MKTEMKDDGVQKKEESTASFIIFTRARKRLRKRLRIIKIVRVVQIIVLRKGAQTQMVRSRQAGTKNTGKTDFTHGKRGVQ